MTEQAGTRPTDPAGIASESAGERPGEVRVEIADVIPSGERVPPIEIRPQQWEIVRQILLRHVPGCSVWAFGSRARGRAKPYSDLDLALLGPRPLGPDEAAALAEAFSESDLPWKVDVVDLATASEAFRRAIEPDRVLVQAGGGPAA